MLNLDQNDRDKGFEAFPSDSLPFWRLFMISVGIAQNPSERFWIKSVFKKTRAPEDCMCFGSGGGLAVCSGCNCKCSWARANIFCQYPSAENRDKEQSWCSGKETRLWRIVVVIVFTDWISFIVHYMQPAAAVSQVLCDAYPSLSFLFVA